MRGGGARLPPPPVGPTLLGPAFLRQSAAKRLLGVDSTICSALAGDTLHVYDARPRDFRNSSTKQAGEQRVCRHSSVCPPCSWTGVVGVQGGRDSPLEARCRPTEAADQFVSVCASGETPAGTFTRN